MANQTWLNVEKTFIDKHSGLHLKVMLIHGGLEIRSGYGNPEYKPVTWGAIAVLPKKDELIPNFAIRMGATQDYERMRGKRGNTLADAEVRKNGSLLDINIQTIHGEIGKFADSPNAVMQALHGELTRYNLHLEEHMATDIKTFLDTNMTAQAREKAKLVFDRTGERSTARLARG